MQVPGLKRKLSDLISQEILMRTLLKALQDTEESPQFLRVTNRELLRGDGVTVVENNLLGKCNNIKDMYNECQNARWHPSVLDKLALLFRPDAFVV